VIAFARRRAPSLTKRQVYVIAAGGIYDGRGLAAALMFGAEAVWVGTRFVASTEAAAPKKHKDLWVGRTTSMGLS
jgi:NAD(P)H-dependent flavin oxidoreductase YrpB (nitropropane dioxygenase family)